MIEIITNGKCTRCHQLRNILQQVGIESKFIYIQEGVDIPKEMGKSLPIAKIENNWFKYSPDMVKTLINEIKKLKNNSKKS